MSFTFAFSLYPDARVGDGNPLCPLGIGRRGAFDTAGQEDGRIPIGPAIGQNGMTSCYLFTVFAKRLAQPSTYVKPQMVARFLLPYGLLKQTAQGCPRLSIFVCARRARAHVQYVFDIRNTKL